MIRPLPVAASLAAVVVVAALVPVAVGCRTGTRSDAVLVCQDVCR
jgi:hypothetical protein